MSDGTVSLPFCGESSPVVTSSLYDCVCDSIGLFGLFPGLKQSTVAVQFADRFAVASAFPTPAS